jgi:hypothetical protein
LKANLHKTEKKEEAYNNKNVHLEPTHAWDKSLRKHTRTEITTTKAIVATKSMEKEKGAFLEKLKSKQSRVHDYHELMNLVP